MNRSLFTMAKAWQRLAEVCVRFTLNTTDTFDYETHKSRTGTTNNRAQKNKHITMVDTTEDMFIHHLAVNKQHG